MASNVFDQLEKVVGRLIETVPFFKGLKPAEVFEFLSKAKQTTFKKGEVVFREGDEAAQQLYLVMKGSCEVRKTLADGSSDVVHTLDVGQCIGEMALVDNQPRSATVVAKTDALLLGCDGDFVGAFPNIAFRLYENLAHIIAQRHLDVDRELKLNLRPVCEETCVKEITKTMPPPAGVIGSRGLTALMELGQPYAVAKGEYVVKENSLGQNMYIVLEGELAVSKAVEGEESRLAVLKRGAYFGETALVSEDHGRTANVQALDNAKLIRLNASHLQKTPALGALIYKELARIFSMRLRRSTQVLMQTVGRECQRDCPMMAAT